MVFLFFTSFFEKRDTIASVNGENIYSYEIERVKNQYDEIDVFIKEEDVLDETISKLLVIQEGIKLDISLTDDELDEILETIKRNHPVVYDKGIKIYGEEDYKKGIKYITIYNRTKAFFENSDSQISFEDWVDELRHIARIYYY
jgi:hypothetical protein